MRMPDWYLDEVRHAGGEHLDAAYVPVYDQKAGTDPNDDLNALCELGLNRTHALVDMGAGTGTFALAAAPLCRRVVAIDVSPVMLSLMREKAAKAGIENIEVVQAGFLSYEHEGEAADFVYSRHALHHLPDFWKALALQRMAAMMKPGGVLYLADLIFSCEPDEIDGVVEGWLGNAADDPKKGWTRAELATHVREEYSPFSWLLEAMIERAGFTIQQAQHSAARIRSVYVCVKR